MVTKRSHILKQVCFLQVCLSMCDLSVITKHERVKSLLSWWRWNQYKTFQSKLVSCRPQSIDLPNKSVEWFLDDTIFSLECISEQIIRSINATFVFKASIMRKMQHVALWSSGYHYCTTSFNKIWTQILRRFKPCSRCDGDLGWWDSLTMVPAGNKV